jgi:uncharacterized delta-60 repeat protein
MITCLSMLLLSVFAAFAADGTLDVTFNASGTPPGTFVTTNQFTDATVANAVVVRYDGAIVLGGTASPAGGGQDFALLILDANGTAAAGSGVTNHVGTVGSADIIRGLAVQPDLKIIAVGESIQTGGYPSQFVVARYLVDGQLDSSFGTNGVVTVDFSAVATGAVPVSAGALAGALLRDGRIVVVGRAQEDGDVDNSYFYAVAVLNQDGSLDSSFNSGAGRAIYGTTAISGNTASFASSVAIQSVGAADNIILAGQAVIGGADPNVFQIIRVLPSGNLDLTFAVNGVDTVPFVSAASQANGIDVYPDGRIVAIGTQVPDVGDSAIVVTRRLINGGADTSFNGSGVLTVALADNTLTGAALNIQNDGKIIVVGGYTSTGGQGFITYRIVNTGVIDATFNSAGTPGYNQQELGESSAQAVALQNDGKIVVVGSAEDNQQMGALRYLNSNLANVVYVVPTFTSPSDSYGNCSSNPPTLSGTAQNPSNITVYVNGVESGRTVTTGATNTWTFTPAAPLATGGNFFQIVAEYKSGNMNAVAATCCAIGLGPQGCLSRAIRQKYCPNCVTTID